MNSYVIAIPSLGRADRQHTLKALQGLDVRKVVFVGTSEDRAEYGRRITGAEVVDVGVEGIARKRNAMLEHFNGGDRVVFLDDDLKGFHLLQGPNKLTELDSAGIDTMLQAGFKVLDKTGAHLFGLYPIKNHFFMKPRIHYRAFIAGACSGMVIDDLRYDESFGTREDYDFCIRSVLRYGCAPRLDMYCYATQYLGGPGGCQTYRTDEMEAESCSKLISLYPDFVRMNPTRKNQVLLRFPK